MSGKSEVIKVGAVCDSQALQVRACHTMYVALNNQLIARQACLKANNNDRSKCMKEWREFQEACGRASAEGKK